MSHAIVPIPRISVTTRVATMNDLPFMDELQRRHSRMVGYFPTQQFKGYVDAEHVLIAEQPGAQRIGYIIAKDRYLKRDEVGVVYQLNVAPGAQRKLIGATLLQAVFERAAYGCRLFCCWCAQDIEANRFWESMGFVPLAFRAGSKGKKRVHIFWQRRIDAGDTGTAYWYPFQTNSGAIRQDRLVFPIPPGVHWGDVRAVQLPVASGQLPVMRTAAGSPNRKSKIQNPKSTGGHLQITPPGKVGIFVGGRIKYVDRPGYVAPADAKPVKGTRRAKPPAPKFDPKHIAAARELRDRWLERVNGGEGSLLPRGKYEVGRGIDVVAPSALPMAAPRQLPEPQARAA